MNLVQDKVTIITGGTRGIGFAAAKIFIDNGAKVSIFGETQEEVDTALAQLKEPYIQRCGYGSGRPGGTEAWQTGCHDQ